MKKILLCIFSFIGIASFAQNDSVTVIEDKKEPTPATKVFYAQKIINTKSVEVLRKGVLEFNVGHSFGDIAGDNGGGKSFFGLDNASDVRIGFQTGLSDRLNLITARTRGASDDPVQNLWEIGLKYQLLRQVENDPSHPVSLTVFVNNVMSTRKSSDDPTQEHYFEDFGSRQSQVLQLLLARKFGKVSFQLNPLYLHTAYVIPGDDKNVFALGGAVRIPLSKKIVILADYFHPFRSESAKAAYELQDISLRDPFGVGLEIITEGHVFHLNFTNTRAILENRFVRHTASSWGDGEFRWAFTISRNFILFRDKKSKPSN